ncbi:MAG: bifunctional diaminohydroxyphosphoribosylaminopyrimidine deaminase/5-amino-6-(5-phosphoribosylamino)uracil reductase RibD [Candidatus Zixiibacteriota bacterium]
MDQKELDRHWMAEAISLAEKGAGRTSPNPVVGAVIVRDGEVVGRGYHQRAGGPHAETIAIKDAGNYTAGSTLYVNLEPCTHWGKTPPCVEAILEAGITTVVCAMQDPNPKINGAGIAWLREHGIGVRTGVLQRTALRQNEAHVKFVVTGLPLVTLKIAQTLDGKIASPNGKAERLTGPAAQKFVHALRARTDAVLVGKNTVLSDDPRLTVRAVKGRDPLRLILDSWGKIPRTAGVFANNDDRKTVRIGLAIGKRPTTQPYPDCFDWYVSPDDRHQIDLHEVLANAARNNITSILVEGGGQVFGSFLRERLADKVHILMAPRFLGAGVNALGTFRAPSILEAVRLVDASVRWLGQDLLLSGYPDYEPEGIEDAPSVVMAEDETDGDPVVDTLEIASDE